MFIIKNTSGEVDATRVPIYRASTLTLLRGCQYGFDHHVISQRMRSLYRFMLEKRLTDGTDRRYTERFNEDIGVYYEDYRVFDSFNSARKTEAQETGTAIHAYIELKRLIRLEEYMRVMAGSEFEFILRELEKRPPVRAYFNELRETISGRIASLSDDVEALSPSLAAFCRTLVDKFVEETEGGSFVLPELSFVLINSSYCVRGSIDGVKVEIVKKAESEIRTAEDSPYDLVFTLTDIKTSGGSSSFDLYGMSAQFSLYLYAIARIFNVSPESVKLQVQGIYYSAATLNYYSLKTLQCDTYGVVEKLRRLFSTLHSHAVDAVDVQNPTEALLVKVRQEEKRGAFGMNLTQVNGFPLEENFNSVFEKLMEDSSDKLYDPYVCGGCQLKSYCYSGVDTGQVLNVIEKRRVTKKTFKGDVE